jgi:hypothetical protein
MAKASVTNIKPSLKKRDAKIAKAKRDLEREAAEFGRKWLALPEPRRMEVYRSIMAASRAQRILRGEETAPILRLVQAEAHG